MSTLAHPLRRQAPKALGALLLVAVLGLLIALPLGTILLQAFVDGRSLTGEHVARVLTEEVYWVALFNTVVVCGGAALVATVLGALFAWIFVRTDTLGRARSSRSRKSRSSFRRSSVRSHGRCCSHHASAPPTGYSARSACHGSSTSIPMRECCG